MKLIVTNVYQLLPQPIDICMSICRLNQLAADGEGPPEVNPAGPTASVEVTSAPCTAHMAEEYIQT